MTVPPTPTPSPARSPGCAICGRTVAPADRPFCSRRCADVDLARWLRGEYVVPGTDGEAASAADPDDRTSGGGN